jgi:hypothetical protein
MQLGELFKLLHKAEPLAARHRDHICSEAAVHDFAHCPKPMARVYAWRVPPVHQPKRCGSGCRSAAEIV